MRVRPVGPVMALALILAASPASAQAPVDCEGPAGDPEPGTPEWRQRDLENMYCAEQRHLDKAQHPTNLQPVQELGADAYREPARHAGVRFRFDTTTIDGLEAEVYRPCTPAACPDLPETLAYHDGPYPAVVTFHGGASRKELHWWSSQSLAEAGYLVIAFDSEGIGPVVGEAERVVDWLFESGDPLVAEFDGERLGVAGHSAGGVVVSEFGHTDPRVDAVVSWDRAQSTRQPDDVPLNSPSLFLFADYNCQQVPVCQPEPYDEPPPPDGPGDKGEDFQILRDAGVDTMQLARRAATHHDWVPSDLSGNRYAEIVTVHYTLAWFDRYVRGPTEPAVAADAFERLTARAFDGSADRHNISQGFYDAAPGASAGDPLAGNVPYTIEGGAVADRLSFYYLSKCFLTVPGTTTRAVSDDLRHDPCLAPATAPTAVPVAQPETPGGDPASLPATGGGAATLAAILLAGAATAASVGRVASPRAPRSGARRRRGSPRRS